MRQCRPKRWVATIGILIMSAVSAWADVMGWKGNLSYTFQALSAVSGGIGSGLAVPDLTTVSLGADAQVLGEGRTAYVSAIHSFGGQFDSRFIQSMGVVSNIEVPDSRAYVYEAWIEQSWGWGSLKVGWMDLSNEFYTNSASLGFVHSIFGAGTELSGSGVHGPSFFPYVAVSSRIRAYFLPDTYVQVAVIDARPGLESNPAAFALDVNNRDGVMTIMEAGVDSDANGIKASLGFWEYSNPFQSNDGTFTDTFRGIYGVIQSPALWTGTTLFAKGGIANEYVSMCSWSAQAGFTMDIVGLFGTSQWGVGVFQNTVSDSYRRAVSSAVTTESGVEMYLSIDGVNGWQIKPDIQYIVNPAVSGCDHGLVVGLVGTTAFDF
ncbi:hypothetical protein EB093_06230 [bacterium]|nr:hypothetical protein [bacterium]